MNPSTLALIWLLVTLDCALMGYRLSMGRSALLDRRRTHQRRSLAAAATGQPAIAAVAALTAGLVATGQDGLGPSVDDAMVRLLHVAVPYAATILAATAACLAPSVVVRTAASVVIFGPLTLLRPVVVVAAVGVAVLPDPCWQLVLVGVLVVVPGALAEPFLDRRISTGILRDIGAPRSSSPALGAH
jgi:hypothetical protein